jgi:hypothetical protein
VSPTGRRPTVVRLAALRTSRRLRRGWRVSTVVSCSSHPLLKLAELGEGVSVLRSVGELLGGHDRVQAGDTDVHAGVVEDPGVAGEVFVTAWCAVGARHRLHHVQVASVGTPVAEVGLLIQDCIDLDRKGRSLFIAQAGDPQPGVEFFEGSGDAGEVLSLRLHQAVGVLGGPGCPVGPAGMSADDQVLDAVAIEDLDDAGEVRLGGR